MELIAFGLFGVMILGLLGIMIWSLVYGNMDKE